MTSNVFPRETSRGTPCLCVAFAGLLHRTTPSRRNAAGIGPVVPNLHQTGSSAVNPTPYTLTTVPPPTVPALGSSADTSASPSGSKYVELCAKSTPPLLDASTANARSIAAAANVGVSHRSTAEDTADAPETYTPPNRHESALPPPPPPPT